MNITPEKIIQTVANYYAIPLDQVMTITRKREVVIVRHVSSYFMKEIFKSKMSLALIGQQLTAQRKDGQVIYKDHASILHSIKTVNNLIDSDKKFRKDIETMRHELNIMGMNKRLLKLPLWHKLSLLREANRSLKKQNCELSAEVKRLQLQIVKVTSEQKRSSFNAFVDSERPTRRAYSGYQPIR
jgi:hypothetical protein